METLDYWEHFLPFLTEEHGKRSMVWRFGSSMTVPAEYKAPTETAGAFCWQEAPKP